MGGCAGHTHTAYLYLYTACQSLWGHGLGGKGGWGEVCGRGEVRREGVGEGVGAWPQAG